MPRLHDPSVREAILARLRSLRPDAPRQWGTMTVDQMLWHLGAGLEICLGRLDAGGETLPFPMPRPLLRFIVLNLPWPKSAPTLRATKATQRYDPERERARCLKLLDEFTARPLDGPWPEHPTLGKLSGDQYSRLQAKHFNHHLTQFGA